MRESTIEKKLREEVEKLGGKCLKWVSPGNNARPDRICLMPGGLALFVETKAPGKRPTKLQAKEIKDLRDLGFPAFVVDDLFGVDHVISFIRGGVKR